MNAQGFGTTFAPYTPPPDDPSHSRSQSQSAAAPSSTASNFLKKSPIRPWFPSNESSRSHTTQPYSYQSGGLPTAGTSYGSSTAAAGSNSGGGDYSHNLGSDLGNVADERLDPLTMWETRYNMRVDTLAAFAYLLGPISALICLVLETHNDYVRFHAYQSALLTTPLVFLRILGALIGFPSFLNTILTFTIIIAQLYMAFRAYIDASRNNLSRFYLPRIGHMAEQFLSEE